MKDKHKRNIDYVRISVTDRCNLRCIYCMPEEGIEQVSHSQILTYDEIITISQALAELGVKKIKITGGEPLVRKNLSSLVKGIKKIPGIEKVTLTTNGVLLADLMDNLAQAGIDGVNVSLDTLDPLLFTKITRTGKLEQVLAGIRKVMEYPDISLKINCVPVYETNVQNIVDLAGMAKDNPIHVRFIEMMPIGYGKNFTFQDEDKIKAVLEEAYGSMIPYEQPLGYGPSHYYSLSGFQGKIGFISAISHKFCHNCNRVRMTAEGFLKTCLQYECGTDLRELIKKGYNREDLKQAIQETIYNKPIQHNFTDPETVRMAEPKLMSKIGG